MANKHQLLWRKKIIIILFIPIHQNALSGDLGIGMTVTFLNSVLDDLIWRWFTPSQSFDLGTTTPCTVETALDNLQSHPQLRKQAN